MERREMTGEMQCLFCHLHLERVRYMIVADTGEAWICDQCVAYMGKMLEKEAAKARRTKSKARAKVARRKPA